MKNVTNNLYLASTIASYFLELAKENGQLITHMRLQKLVFFAHAWNLALRNYSLLDEDVQAWETGLVIASIYGEYRSFGKREITHHCYSPQKLAALSKDKTTVALLDEVWRVYRAYSDFKLLEMTHLPNSPWKQARANSTKPKVAVPDEIIREYYQDHLKEIGFL